MKSWTMPLTASLSTLWCDYPTFRTSSFLPYLWCDNFAKGITNTFRSCWLQLQPVSSKFILGFGGFWCWCSQIYASWEIFFYISAIGLYKKCSYIVRHLNWVLLDDRIWVHNTKVGDFRVLRRCLPHSGALSYNSPYYYRILLKFRFTFFYWFLNSFLSPNVNTYLKI